jgi:hypothetical protein
MPPLPGPARAGSSIQGHGGRVRGRFHGRCSRRSAGLSKHRRRSPRTRTRPARRRAGALDSTCRHAAASHLEVRPAAADAYALSKPRHEAAARADHRTIRMRGPFTAAEWRIDTTTECHGTRSVRSVAGDLDTPSSLRDGSSHCRRQRWALYSIDASQRRHLSFAPLMTINGHNDRELMVAITRASPLTLSGRFIQSCALDSCQPGTGPVDPASLCAPHSPPRPLADTMALGPLECGRDGAARVVRSS